MLKKVSIRYFKSCSDVEIDELEDVTALVGRNGVGKSNVLRAINWAARMASGNQPPNERVHLLSNPGDVALEFDLHGNAFRYEVRLMPEGKSPERLHPLEVLTRLGPDGEIRLASKDKEGVRFFNGQEDVTFLADPSYSMLPSIARLPPNPKFTPLFLEVAAFLTGIRYYPLNEPNYEDTSNTGGFVVTQEFIEWMRSDSPNRYSGSDAVMRLLAMHLFHPDRSDELLSLLGSDGLNLVSGVRYLPFTSPSENPSPEPRTFEGVVLAQYYLVQFQISSGPETSRYIGFEDLSHGTRRAIDLVASILYDQSTVMLIEHPEDAVHIGLLIKIMGILQAYSDDLQAIIATHSRAILNTLTLTRLRFVSMAGGQTHVYRLKGNKLSAAERYITNEGEEGGSIADFVEALADVLE